MRRTSKKEEDDTLIPVFLKGLEAQIQDLVNISIITEITAISPGKDRPASSVAREIQRAIKMSAGRTRKRNENHQSATALAATKGQQGKKDSCGVCGKKGHKISEHVYQYRRPTAVTDTKKQKPNTSRTKSCLKHGKYWKPLQKCDSYEAKESNNFQIIEDADEKLNLSDQAVESLFKSQELGHLTISDESEALIQTPVEIGGIPGSALVYSGSNASFISLAFVQEHNVSITPVTGITRGGSGDRIADLEGTATLPVRNRTKGVTLNLEVIQQPKGRDMVIGLPDFKALGFHIADVPAKSPEQMMESDRIVNEVDNEAGDMVDGLTAGELSPKVEEAVKRNAEISMASRFSHPLDVLSIKSNPTDPIWRNINYVNNKDKDRVGEVVEALLQREVMEMAPEECLNSFSLLTVPKKDAYGKRPTSHLS